MSDSEQNITDHGVTEHTDHEESGEKHVDSTTEHHDEAEHAGDDSHDGADPVAPMSDGSAPAQSV